MTESILDEARARRAAGYTWKLIARELGVNVHSLRYHLVAKLNPSTLAARKRAYQRFAPHRSASRSKVEAIGRLLAAGWEVAAIDLDDWRNGDGNNQGWDGWLRACYPELWSMLFAA